MQANPQLAQPRRHHSQSDPRLHQAHHRPQPGPLTYSEARDFCSNATRLSADEFNRLTPNIQRMLGEFTSDLGNAIQQTADQAGRLQDYLDAVSEYASAVRLKDWARKH